MLTLPNILTLSRILAVPLLAFLLWWPEWKLGYAQRFGLVHVDYETQARTIKDSGRAYRSLME